MTKPLLFLFIGCCLMPLVSWAQCPVSVNAGLDQLVCGLGTPVQLNGSVSGPFTSFQWSPAAGLNNPNSISPVANIAGSQTYTLTATAFSNVNLISNGDFEQGAVGFTSDYTFSSNLIQNGTYLTVVSPALVVSTFPPCDDHTFGDGTGQMLLVNGDDVPGDNVWCQTVPVTPNTNYDLSAWVSTVIPLGLAQLQFSVNGQLLGAAQQASATFCEWSQFAAFWNSGNATTAEVCVVSQSTASFGNDFVLDDIEMYGECQVSDEVTVEVLPNAETFIEAYRCLGDCFFIGSTPYCNSGSFSQSLPAANGCDSTVNLELTVLNPVAFIDEPDTLSCYNDFVITLDASFSSAGPFTSYSWTGPNGFASSQQNPLVTAPGLYTLQVTESAGGASCSSVASVQVLIADEVPLAEAGPDQTIGCGGSEVALGGQSAGTDINYEWSGPGGFSSIELAPAVSDTGSYLLLVTNTISGCTARDTAYVGLNASSLSVTATTDTITCANPVAQLGGQVDSSAVDIRWASMTEIVDSVLQTAVDSAGLYILTATDSTGCSVSDTVTVVVDTLRPAFSLDAPSLSCNLPQDSLQLSLNTAYDTLFWQGPEGFSSSAPEPVVDRGGTYVLQVVGTNGCVQADSILVDADFAEPVLLASGAALACGDSSVIISGSSADSILSWQWSGPGGFIGSSSTVSVAATGAYELTATALNGCTATATAIVEAGSDLPGLTAEGGQLDCNSPSLLLSASTEPGNTLLWSGPDGFTATIPNPEVSQPGLYTITAASGSNCAVDTTVLVTVDTLPPQLALAGGTLSCAQPAISLQAFGDSTIVAYAWSGPGGETGSGATFSASEGGVYTLTATAANGCSRVLSTTVSVDTLAPSLSLTADTLNCRQDSVLIQLADSPDSLFYQWEGPGSFSAQSPSLVATLPGLYTLQAINPANGCSGTASLSVVQDALPPPFSPSGDTLSCAQPLAMLQAGPGEGVSSLQWTGPDAFFSTDPNPSASQPGEYQILVEGQNGCRDSALVNVVADTLPPLLQATADTIRCSQPQAALQAFAENAVSFVWFGPSGLVGAGDSLQTVQGGNYIVEATAANGCVGAAVVEVAVDTLQPVVSATGGTLSCTAPSLQLQSTVSPGATLSWSGPDGFASAENEPVVSQPGLYTLLATAANGCTASDTAWVTADALPPELSVAGGTIDCDTPFVFLSSSVSDSNLTYSWSGPDGFTSNQPEPEAATAGTYILTVSAANGCSAVDTALVIVDLEAPELIASGGVINCSNSQLTLTVSTASSGLDYNWAGPSGFNSSSAQPAVEQPGIYFLSATATNGCTGTDTALVVLDTVPPAFALTDDTLTCLVPAITLSANTSIPGLEYTWSGPAGFSSSSPSPEIAQPGLYQLQLTAPNGCTASGELLIIADTEPPAISATADTIRCGQPLSVLSASPDTATVGYSWSGPGGFIGNGATVSVGAAGLYTLVATAANGCTDSLQLEVVSDTVRPSLQLFDLLLDCRNPELPLPAEVQAPGGTLYSWSGPGGFSSSLLNPMVNTAGAYTLLAEAPNGCTDTASLQVQSDQDAPFVQAAALDTLDCQTFSVPLSGTGSEAGSGYRIRWSSPQGSFGESPDSLQTTALTPGSYVLEIENLANGCRAQDTVIVVEIETQPTALQVSLQSPFCPDGNGQLLVNGVVGGSPPYLFALNGGAFEAADSFVNLMPGTYLLEVQDSRLCTFEAAYEILPPPGISLSLPEEVLLELGESRVLQPQIDFPLSLIDSVRWTPSEQLSCADCLSPLVTAATTDQEYTLWIQTTEGCTLTAQTRLRLQRNYELYIPNAFSPGNRDGRNDAFTVFGPESRIRRIRLLRIFDRWGGQVFSGADLPPNELLAGWQGQYRGQPAPSGVYVYYAEVEFADGVSRVFKGEVLLIR